MKKRLATLIAGCLVTSAFAQAPAAATATTTGEAAQPMGEGTKGDMRKTTARQPRHSKKHAEKIAR